MYGWNFVEKSNILEASNEDEARFLASRLVEIDGIRRVVTEINCVINPTIVPKIQEDLDDLREEIL